MKSKAPVKVKPTHEHKGSFPTPKSQRTFENVLEAATELFQEKGFYNTTMRDISARSGLALGAIYYYFASKEELVALFYDRINKKIIDEFRAKYKIGKLENSFKEFIELKIKHLERHKELLVVLLKEAVDPDSTISPFSDHSFAAREQNINLFIDLLKGSKTHALLELKDAAYLLWLAHLVILALWIFDRSADNVATDHLIGAFTTLVGWSAKLGKIPGFDIVTKKLVRAVLAIFQINLR